MMTDKNAEHILAIIPKTVLVLKILLGPNLKKLNFTYHTIMLHT
jgi:hypothetical protein